MKKGYFWGIKKCFACSFSASFLLLILYAGNGILYPVMVETIADIINHIDSYLLSYSKIVYVIMVLGFVYGYRYMSASLSPFLRNRLNANLKITFGRELLEMRRRIPLCDLEQKENQDIIELAVKRMEEHLSEMLLNACIVLSFCIEIVGLLGIIMQFQKWVIPVLLFVAVPLVVVSFKGGRAVFLEDKGIAMLTRWMEYYSQILSDKNHVNERTLFGYSEYINEKYKRAHRKRSDTNTLVLAKWKMRIHLCAVILLIYAMAVIGAMIHSVLSGMLSLGLFITLAGTMVSLAKRIAQTLSRLIFDVAGEIEYMETLNEFFQLGTKTAYSDYCHEKVEFERLEIVNLSYRYPNSEKEVLCRLNLTIEKGKSYSLIGINGAGKSTLIKILTGMYRDYDGLILLNGKDLQTYSDNQLRNIFSLVQQDYAKYQISLKDNLTFGEEILWDTEVLKQTDLYGLINELPEHEHTHLGRLEKGVDLSGGEWQKLAISRALIRKAPFVILDEPTASLSPRMEDEFYSKVLKVKKDETLLLISHRMAATKITDRIILLEGGGITEEGSHQELMNKKGMYYEMFESQRKNY